jgi:hypothetical protein
MTQWRASDAWRLFAYNWIPIGLMAVALALGMALTGFSIKPASVLLPLGAVGLYTGTAYYNAHAPHKRDPLVAFVLGSTAQVVLITLLMTPMTYVAAAANLPMMDASLADLDRALGLDWRAYFSFIYDRPKLIAAVVVGYGMLGLPIFGIPILLGATRRYRRLQEFTLAFALTLIATTTVSAFVPALGTYQQLGIKPDPAIFTPGGYLDTWHALPLVRDGSLRELDVGRSRRDRHVSELPCSCGGALLMGVVVRVVDAAARAAGERCHAVGDADRRRALFRRCICRYGSGRPGNRSRAAHRRVVGRTAGAGNLSSGSRGACRPWQCARCRRARGAVAAAFGNPVLRPDDALLYEPREIAWGSRPA